MATTLAPLSALLTTLANDLEREVVPHLAGQPYVDAMETVEQLRRIVRVRESCWQAGGELLDADLEALPDYCALAACQNLAVDSDGLSRHKLCAPHAAQFEGWVAQVLQSGQVGP